MNKKIIIISIIILLIVIAGGIWWYLSKSRYYSSHKECAKVCKSKGYDEGYCTTPEGIEFLKGLNQYKIKTQSIGSCFIKGDKHCGKKGVCNCYCYSFPPSGSKTGYSQIECINTCKSKGYIGGECTIHKREVLRGLRSVLGPGIDSSSVTIENIGVCKDRFFNQELHCFCYSIQE